MIEFIKITFVTFYVIPMLICLLASWVLQIVSSKHDKPEQGFSLITFIPVANIFGALFTIVGMIYFICYSIIMIPTLIKNLFK